MAVALAVLLYAGRYPVFACFVSWLTGVDTLISPDWVDYNVPFLSLSNSWFQNTPSLFSAVTSKFASKYSLFKDDF